ncbi:MAG: hypothetical protein KDA21_07270 [Phycisphaerales bacterium]|nr:hypothetical protein [Phycisphaerales bacterium]
MTLLGWLSVIVPLVVPVMLLITAAISPHQAHRMVAKEKGIVEHLTVIVLLPGIAAGLWGVWVAHRRRLTPRWWIPAWFLMWTMACVYFAGEEISWGQHYFGWSAPEAISEINDQHETNLHNMSSWLDQKPRALVELFIVVGGLIIPIIHALQGQKRPGPSRWDYWVWPNAACATAAAMMVASRVGKTLDHSMPDLMAGLGNSETREYTVALFLTVYMVVWAYRVSVQRRNAASPGSA